MGMTGRRCGDWVSERKRGGRSGVIYVQLSTRVERKEERKKVKHVMCIRVQVDNFLMKGYFGES